MGPTAAAPKNSRGSWAVRHFRQFRVVFILIGTVFRRRRAMQRALDLTGLSGIVSGGDVARVRLPVAVDAVYRHGITQSSDVFAERACPEMLYLPTSNDIKFKAKAWIDVVGARTAKALARSTTPSRGTRGAGTAAAVRERAYFIVSLALFGVALNMGRRYDTIKESGAIVGEEDAAPAATRAARVDGSRGTRALAAELGAAADSTSTTTRSSRIRDSGNRVNYD